jgi:hypothetical protein
MSETKVRFFVAVSVSDAKKLTPYIIKLCYDEKLNVIKLLVVELIPKQFSSSFLFLSKILLNPPHLLLTLSRLIINKNIKFEGVKIHFRHFSSLLVTTTAFICDMSLRLLQ